MQVLCSPLKPTHRRGVRRALPPPSHWTFDASLPLESSETATARHRAGRARRRAVETASVAGTGASGTRTEPQATHFSYPFPIEAKGWGSRQLQAIRRRGTVYRDLHTKTSAKSRAAVAQNHGL